MSGSDWARLPISCPFCGRTNNGHHGVKGPATPEAGDVSVCWGCGEVMVYESATSARRPTDDECAAISSHPGVALALAARERTASPLTAVAMTRALMREMP